MIETRAAAAPPLRLTLFGDSPCTPSTIIAPPTSPARSPTSRNEDAKLLAGGQTLMPTMKQRLAAPAALVDLRKIAELRASAATATRS